MASICQSLCTMFAAAAFAITLYICVAGNQDFLISTLKSIGAYLLVRAIGRMLASMIISTGVRGSDQ